ncbi:glutamate synthase large subunit [Chlorella sorokiniana]|uniref:Glutamate synthase large subunit n=1 Tax=Chlorella sorokiniana TaxID=3076 RepID=A0A2P6TZK6_CHLSO|nr:glutamate synthase large subunit [Chlorella sorokiniana]|eukprot:PRW59480.1 glutamate synthase large subunit [Chlorella sorokiniana]
MAAGVGRAEQPGSVGRLLARSMAASDAKVLAFLTFVGQAVPGMLALAGTAELGKGGHWHSTVLQALMVLMDSNKAAMSSLLERQPAVGLGLLTLALDGMLAAHGQLQIQQAVDSGESAEAQQVAERMLGLLLASGLCSLAPSSRAAGGIGQLTKQARRHLDGTALAALAAADALEAAMQRVEPISYASSDSACCTKMGPGTVANCTVAPMRAWAQAAAAEPASLPGGQATLLAVLDALSDSLPTTSQLSNPGQQDSRSLDALALLVPRVPWLGPELCRRGLLTRLCQPTAVAGAAAMAGTVWRLMAATAAQLSADGQLPAAVRDRAAQAEHQLAESQRELPGGVTERP